MKSKTIVLTLLLSLSASPLLSQPLIIDHTCTNISKIPVAAIETAKAQLHIGYGFTSHGSQLVTGMAGLVEFMNNKGWPHDLFAFNNTGAGGALHLVQGDGYSDGDLDHDAGYYPAWVEETRAYLGAPNASGRGSNHPEINVIMWAWCGQLSGYSRDDVFNQYLNEMNQLEIDYAGITFVYMTGHSDGSGIEGTLHQNNQTIRQFCIANNKVLFDFYDIECYDPDGRYFGDKYVTDACSYDGGNWAVEWQNSHTEGLDWYSCEAAHSQPLVANLKAYAVWWMLARLAGWGGPTATADNGAPDIHAGFVLAQNYPNPFNSGTTIQFSVPAPARVRLAVYDISGRLVVTLVDQELSPDVYNVPLSLAGHPSGLYFYQMSAGSFREAKKFVYTK